jgi:hypothetical protein
MTEPLSQTPRGRTSHESATHVALPDPNGRVDTLRCNRSSGSDRKRTLTRGRRTFVLVALAAGAIALGFGLRAHKTGCVIGYCVSPRIALLFAASDIRMLIRGGRRPVFLQDLPPSACRVPSSLVRRFDFAPHRRHDMTKSCLFIPLTTSPPLPARPASH